MAMLHCGKFLFAWSMFGHKRMPYMDALICGSADQPVVQTTS